MSKYQFSLETALKLRSREQDAAQQRLAQARRAAEDIEEQLRNTRERYDRVEAMLRDGIDGQADVPLAAFVNGRTWLAATRSAIASLRERLDHARDVCGQRRAELLVASRRTKTLEQLAERRETEHLRREQLGEQRELDEMATILTAANASGGGPGVPLASRPVA